MGHESAPLHPSLVTAILLFTVGILGLSSRVHGNRTRSGSSVSGPNVVLNIPSGGLTSDRVAESPLGGSQVLLVVDESNEAVFMPQTESSREGGDAENLNKFVYAVDNGACNFSKTLTYEDIFPGLGSSDTKTFWVKTTGALDSGPQKSSQGNSVSTSVTQYAFTNPSSEKLQGRKVSFCVRFHSATAVTTPSPEATAVSTEASGDKPTLSSGPSKPSGDTNTTPGEDTAPAPPSLDRTEQASLQALIKKETSRETKVKAEEEIGGKEGTPGREDITTTVDKMPGAFVSRESAASSGVTPAGYYLTVVVHSSASHAYLGTVTIFVLLTISLSTVLRVARS
ncbi:toxoplasma gondii family a protein [Cystoisospora suis]|uniref:Toxoplasma gondii family a protein n=1 Tax=Cystoisospora suis TaxID=483139 RepID=A0A2C6KY31_9APIC|nr:toxoplasma gondii family a protein [Cystoisospora suis]